MRQPAVIGLDLGGTKLAGAVFGRRGRILHKTMAHLEGRKGRGVGALIRAEIRTLLEAAAKNGVPIAAIGVSVPGISYSKSGRVWAPNIPGWKNYPLRAEIEAALSDPLPSGRRQAHSSKRIIQSFATSATPVRIAIDSDRVCYILGEAWQGAAAGCKNAVFIAVGTGIGAGIMVDGQILRGAHDVAGAIGWLALDRPFRQEYVQCGCFEYHASGAGLAKVAKQTLNQLTTKFRGASSQGDSGDATLHQSKEVTAQEIFSAYQRRDAIAIEVIAEAIQFWGMAVANLVSLLNPEKIIFGGGVFGPATQFLKDIQAEAKKWGQPISMKQVKLGVSKLGADAGLYGAGYLALETSKLQKPISLQ